MINDTTFENKTLVRLGRNNMYTRSLEAKVFNIQQRTTSVGVGSPKSFCAMFKVAFYFMSDFLGKPCRQMHHKGYKHLYDDKQARSSKLCLSCALQFVGTMYDRFQLRICNFSQFIYLKHSHPNKVLSRWAWEFLFYFILVFMIPLSLSNPVCYFTANYNYETKANGWNILFRANLNWKTSSNHDKINDRGEPEVSYRWTGWSSRLQENKRWP